MPRPIEPLHPVDPTEIEHHEFDDDVAGGAQKLELEMESRTRQMTAIAELGQAALSGVEALLLMGQACALAADTLNADYARILEYDPDADELVARGGVGFEERFEAEEISSDTVYAFTAGDVVRFSDIGSETRFSTSQILRTHDIAAGAIVPLPGRRTPLGVLCVYSKTHRIFRDYEVQFLRALSNVLAAAIETSRNREIISDLRDRAMKAEEAGQVGSWVWMRGKNNWEWSDSLYKMLDTRPFEGKRNYVSILSYVHPEDRPRVSDEIDASIRRRSKREFFHRILLPDDTVRFVSSTVEPVYDPEGGLVRVRGSMHDLTDRKLSAQEQDTLFGLVERAAQEWRTALDAMDVLVIVTDADGLVARLNEPARHLLHRPFDEIVGGTLPDGSEPWTTLRRTIEEVRDSGREVIHRAVDPRNGSTWDVSGRWFTAGVAAQHKIVLLAQQHQ